WHDPTYGSLVKDYVESGRVRLAYLNFPLSQHQNAMPAAEAAMCASVQDKFWPMHDSLFSSQQTWETLPNAIPAFDSIAARLGVAMPAWRNCVARLLPLDAKPIRALRARGGIRDRYRAWGETRRDPGKALLWMHAPSVGEGLQARPVLELMRQRHPEVQLAYTFFSPSAESFGR